MSNSAYFIAGYQRSAQQADIFWLTTHPQATELIFSKDYKSAFVFDDAQIALDWIKAILLAENRPWMIPVVKNIHFKKATPLELETLSLEEIEVKIKELLKLFNERSHQRLELFLTLNPEEQTIRGYGMGQKIDETVAHFVALLAVKGLKAEYLGRHTFVVALK